MKCRGRATISVDKRLELQQPGRPGGARESGTALRLQERKRRLRCAPANQGGISEAARRTAGTAARQPHWPGGPLLSHKSAD